MGRVGWFIVLVRRKNVQIKTLQPVVSTCSGDLLDDGYSRSFTFTKKAFTRQNRDSTMRIVLFKKICVVLT